VHFIPQREPRAHHKCYGNLWLPDHLVEPPTDLPLPKTQLVLDTDWAGPSVIGRSYEASLSEVIRLHNGDARRFSCSYVSAEVDGDQYYPIAKARVKLTIPDALVLTRDGWVRS